MQWVAGNRATSAQQQSTEAKKIIMALGLDWNRLNMGDQGQKDAAIELIHDKMAS
jgi:hypothetical protein